MIFKRLREARHSLAVARFQDRARKMGNTQLFEYFDLTISTQGECLRRYGHERNAWLLETLVENAEASLVLARELVRRATEEGVPVEPPAVDRHVQQLLSEYQRRQAEQVPSQ